MASGRILSKSLSTSRRYARLHVVAGPLAEFCQTLFPLLVAHADECGRLEGDAFTVRHVVCPTSPRTEAEVERALDLLAAVRLIVPYQTAHGDPVIQILRFDEHQLGLKRRGVSKFPAPPDHLLNDPPISAQVAGSNGDLRAHPAAEPSNQPGEAGPRPAMPSEEKGREGKGREENAREARPLAPGTRGAPLLRGPNPNAAFDSPRVYVPHRLHAKLIALRNHGGAEAELFAWYAEVGEAWAHGEHAHDEPGADMFAFWQDRYAERWPTAARKVPATKARPAWATPQGSR